MTTRPVLLPSAINTFFSAFILILLFIAPSSGQGAVVVEYFYEDGCLKCAQAAPVIDDVIQRYDNITSFQYEISTAYNGKTGYDRMKLYGVFSVPAVVIDSQTIILYSDYNGNKARLEELLIEGIEKPVPDNTSNQSTPETEKLPELSVLVVFIAGLLAGFNPCLLAVLAFLASITLSSNRGRLDLLIIISGFCAGIFAVYMLVGLGLLRAVKQQPAIHNSITLLLVVVIGLLGLWHLYDAYHLKLKDRSSFKTPKSFIRLVSSMEQGKNFLIISFLAGGIFSLVKAPCVGAVYFAILDMLISRGNISEGSLYLGIFNLGIILPVLILGALLAFGLSPERVTEFKEKKRVEIRLVTGLILIVLALLIYLHII
jgi:cytochrome c biogenesis protein CcdA